MHQVFSPTRFVVAAIVSACLCGAIGSAQAAIATASMPVSATIPTACTATAGTNMAFGTLAASLSVTQTDTTGTITVNCTTGGAYTVISDLGSYALSTQKRMQKGTSGNYLSYEIYTDTGRSTLFPTTVASATSTNGTGASQTITVYGRLATQTALAAGVYGDSLTFTVTY